ncbi:MAG: GNAT family N-acetyltransferase [bacterium]
MSTPSLVYLARPATFDDLDEVAVLLHRVFGVQTTAEVLKWKFSGCAGHLVGSTVLIRDHKIVGFLGQIPLRIRMAGRDLLAVQGADVGILGEHRRLDAFLNLLVKTIDNLEAQGVALSYGTANANAAITLSTLLGQSTVSKTPLLVLPLRNTVPSPARPEVRLLTRFFTACIHWTERCAARFPAPAHHPLRMIRLDRFDSRFDTFWERIRDDYLILLVRDASHLNWRYVEAPGVVYERIGIESTVSGEIEGYAVLSLSRRRDQLRGRICDLVTPRQGNRRAAHKLIATAIQWFRSQGADIADVWMFPHTHLRLPLRLHGFIPRNTTKGRFQANMLTSSAALHLQGVERAENWFLAIGDSDTA